VKFTKSKAVSMTYVTRKRDLHPLTLGKPAAMPPSRNCSAMIFPAVSSDWRPYRFLETRLLQCCRVIVKRSRKDYPDSHMGTFLAYYPST
jgi:hypothetical protein